MASELSAINRALSRIQREGLAPGPIFCDWGSGLGGVCGVAALNGFKAMGIEIERVFVDSARVLAESLDLPLSFAEGTFLLPGDQDLIDVGTLHTTLAFDSRAWDDLDLSPAACDAIFAYPWPGEEVIVDRAFARHASADALLITYHDFDRVLVQRKVQDRKDLQTVGWM